MCWQKRRINKRREYLSKYRDYAVKEFTKSQESFDKVLLTLASGALGISISFTDNIIDIDTSKSLFVLFLAWFFWGSSLFVLLLSHSNSVKAWNKTIDQVDFDTLPEKNENPGEPYNSRVGTCNSLGLFLFMLGLVSFFIYLSINFYLR